MIFIYLDPQKFSFLPFKFKRLLRVGDVTLGETVVIY